MFILFGTRRMRKSLGTVMLLCQRCQRPSAHAVFKVHTWFTLFFIPIFPFSVKYATACPMCGATSQIDKAHAEQLESAAAQQAATPVEMTPDGPITPYPPTDAPTAMPPAPAVGADLGPHEASPGPALASPGAASPPAPDWWLASDGKWYPPELHQDAR